MHPGQGCNGALIGNNALRLFTVQQTNISGAPLAVPVEVQLASACHHGLQFTPNRVVGPGGRDAVPLVEGHRSPRQDSSTGSHEHQCLEGHAEGSEGRQPSPPGRELGQAVWRPCTVQDRHWRPLLP